MYRVLYRKWRPKVFADVIGQPQVTKTLSAQIREDRLSHAYLFTGSRGTGKTTCAKIFSKAVNCLAPVNGDPCNECEICKGIDNGTVLDIVEIDAASNRGIDDIRTLRDEVNFSPSQAKYRVYIIDEVHMLTIEAFNALLKTLEEPPEHVKFILATTEVHKLPSTILSRCQRFDFRRIEPSAIADRLVDIAGAEGARLQYDAAMLVARIADGGMRDALSLLDRCLSVSDDVTTDVVSASAGLMSREYIYDLMDAIAEKDTARCLCILDELHKASCDTERLCTELIDRFRSFLIIKTVKHPENLIVCTASELERIKASAAAFTDDGVLYSLSVLASATEAIRRTQNRRIEAEMALIRLCRPDTDASASALAARVAELERELAELKRSGVKSVPAPAVRQPELSAEKSEDKHAGAPVVFERDVHTENIPLSDADIPFPDNAPEDNGVKESDFAGFGAEKPSGGFASAFAESDGDEDDEPFDFEAFMNEHAGKAGKHDSADYEDDDIPPFPDEYDAPPDDFDMPFSEPEPEPAYVPADNGKTVYDKPRGESIDPKVWKRIALSTEQKFPPLIGALTGSSATLYGNVISVKFGEQNLKLFVGKDYLSRYVSEAAEEILGKKFNVRIE